MLKELINKIQESLLSVLPIAVIIFVLAVSFVPLSPGTFLLLTVGVALLIIGMGLFNMGADMSMQLIGEKTGARLSESKRGWLIAGVAFILGMLITLAEPDLRILASQLSSEIQPYLMILVVSVGVGLFLAIAFLRILLGISLKYILLVGYVAVIALSFFVPEGFRPVSFDSGGVTTGPMTVPFILSLGAGMASMRYGKNASSDSFGLISLSSLGPVLAVEILSVIFSIGGGAYSPSPVEVISDTRDAAITYFEGLGYYSLEVLIALAPIAVFFIFFQLITKSFSKKQTIKIVVGLAYLFFGLTVFLTGANVGFMPVGREIGASLGSYMSGWILIPVSMVLGYFVVAAEPAVHALERQVLKLSAGGVSLQAIRQSLRIGVSIALGLSALRVITGISILYLLVPLYIAALVLSFFTPDMYVGIAFDAGGVASGAMVSGFILPLMIGACMQLSGNVYNDAFGCIAFVALTPLVSVQILGIIYKAKVKKATTELLIANDDLIEYKEVSYATEEI
ncbi:MAG: DUF1538 domain-containing protein [Clostridia bacterium]|nr:DUF1538 domain-containing protein [Clostridia bacterium]